jgi:hypothetical protein
MGYSIVMKKSEIYKIMGDMKEAIEKMGSVPYSKEIVLDKLEIPSKTLQKGYRMMKKMELNEITLVDFLLRVNNLYVLEEVKSRLEDKGEKRNLQTFYQCFVDHIFGSQYRLFVRSFLFMPEGVWYMLDEDFFSGDYETDILAKYQFYYKLAYSLFCFLSSNEEHNSEEIANILKKAIDRNYDIIPKTKK